jgi:glycerophosphoryl diester phosphodiesterase
VNPWLRAARPAVIAHRGDSLLAPEQTLVAYRLAVERGAEMIEADVHRTRDGRLVMLHDGTLDRTTSGSGPVGEIDLDDIRRLDAGSWFGREFEAEPVPTLEELFDLASDLGVTLCLEVKRDGPTAAAATVAAELAIDVAAEIARRARIGADVLSSFDHAALAAAKARYPALTLAPDRLPERGPSDAATLVHQAAAIGAEIIQHHHADLDAALIAGCHAAGLAVWAWPTTKPEDIERSHRLGVDGLMGDDVAAIVAEVATAGD